MKSLLIIKIFLLWNNMAGDQFLSNNINRFKNNIAIVDSSKSIFFSRDTGVIVLKENYQNSILSIYNSNGTIWHSFKLTDNFKNNFMQPEAIKADDRILVFNCIGENESYYLVCVSKSPRLIKYIKKRDKDFVFQSWQKRISSVFSVDFDPQNNPLRETPDLLSKKMPFRKNDFYHPVKIKGDWVQVESEDTSKRGWVMWRTKGGKLIVHLYDEA